MPRDTNSPSTPRISPPSATALTHERVSARFTSIPSTTPPMITAVAAKIPFSRAAVCQGAL